MRQQPRPNEIYRHFKGKCYQILSVAIHSETNEKMVVYQQLYAPYAVYVRPLDMFMSEVDRVKYPEVMQVYRFEKIQESFWLEPQEVEKESVVEENKMPVSKSAEPVKESVTEAQAPALDEGLLAFLEADSYEEKLEILNNMHSRITDSMIDTMAVSLDVEVKDGDIEQRYSELMSCLLKLEHFECNRLR